MSTAIGWNRITEVRGGGGRAAGLEYHYPCGHTRFYSSAAILADISLPSDSDKILVKAWEGCPEGCKVEESEAESPS